MAHLDERTAQFIADLLKDANNALANNHFDEAEDFYQEALAVDNPSPELKEDIRQALKVCSDKQLSEHTPPEWDLAQRMLDMITQLALQNDESQAWQNTLKLKRGRYLLESDSPDEGFEIFKNLVSDAEKPEVREKLIVDIAQIVREYMREQADQQRWNTLPHTTKRLQDLWATAGEPDAWTETFAYIFTKADQALQRSRNFTYVILGCFLVAALGYIIFNLP